MAIVFSERENNLFRQLVLLFSNVLWIALSFFYFNTEWEIQCALVRCTYFFFSGVVRTELSIEKDKTDLERDDDVLITNEGVSACKVWVCDFLTWAFLVVMFGMPVIYPLRVIEAAWCLAFMTLPERVYSPYYCWLF